MEQLNLIRDTYQRIILDSESQLAKIKHRIYHISILRLMLFTTGIVGIIYFWDESNLVLSSIVTITFVAFLLLVKLHTGLFNRKEYLEKKIEINKQELQAIAYDTSAFDNGEEFIDPTHLYTYDLDIFGDHSLFQYINRTATQPGKKRLAEWMNAHLKNKAEIEERQEAIKEFAPELEMRQHFRTLGLLHKDQAADEEEIRNWASSPEYYRNKWYFRALTILIPLVNAVCLGLIIVGVCSFTIWGIFFTSIGLLSTIFSKRISQMQTIYGKKMQILTTYTRLIHVIEEKEMKSNALKRVKKLLESEGQTASQAVKQLTGLMSALDQRNNMIMQFVLNGLFFWELRQVIKIEMWKRNFSANLPRWIEAIGEMDAYCSLGTFAYNHPGYIFPEITSDPFCMKAETLGHPLMDREKCVHNGIQIAKRPFFVVITGANMAGKSTYLRTIGVSYLLACIGAPVWAKKMKLYPSQLITSLRTTDSLTDNESYFFAELKRLKLIIDKLNSGEELFIILDEILKGTNSMDKQRGSFALIKQFISLKANGIIATHDLLLGSLVELFPEEIHNYCFEADITNNELTFSYKLRDGVAQNMNACFLMKKMGIAVIDE